MTVAVSQDDVLTLVHPGRRVELFREPIRASELMSKYPRHCIARPDVFEFPWIAVHPQSLLPLGRVFFLVPYHTMYMLLKSRRRHHHHHEHSSSSRHHRGDHQESFEAGNLYRFIKRWVGRKANEEAEESSCRYYKAESPVDSSPRPRVTSGELIELLKLKPCLRQPDSERRKLNLRVTFADSAPISRNKKCPPCDQQNN